VPLNRALIREVSWLKAQLITIRTTDRSLCRSLSAHALVHVGNTSADTALNHADLYPVLSPLELAKRIGFYHSCQAIGSMMSGALQVAITNTLHGTAGLEGWRWLVSAWNAVPDAAVR
jgi:hypothetical protein